MIKCIACEQEADELFRCTPYCKKHFDDIVKQKWRCPICGDIFRLFDDNGIQIDGTFACMHDECYIYWIEHPETDWVCNGGRVNEQSIL